MKRGMGKSNLTSKSSSNIGNLIAAKTFLKGTLKAKRVVVKAADVKSKTDIHYLNPRNKDALSLEAVADIFSSIVERGVSTEGLAIEKDGKYYVLDASRRRFCCIEGDVDLPLWVIEGQPSDTELLKLINDSQEVKKWSYPEHANYLLKIVDIRGLDPNMPAGELAKELGMGRESFRKRMESLDINDELRKVFVDYEGIPNTYYGELAKLQRKLTKAKVNISDRIGEFETSLYALGFDGSVAERQKKTLDALQEFVNGLTKSTSNVPKWKETKLGEFDTSGVSAKRKVTRNGRKTVYEFNRLPVEKQRMIDEFIEQLLPPKS